MEKPKQFVTSWSDLMEEEPGFRIVYVTYGPARQRSRLFRVKGVTYREIKSNLQQAGVANGDFDPILGEPIPINAKLYYNVPEITLQLLRDGTLADLRDEIDRGADIDDPILGGGTPLHFAVVFNRMDMVQYLLQLGADRSIRDDRGYTAEEVAKYRQSEMVEYIRNYQIPEGKEPEFS